MRSAEPLDTVPEAADPMDTPMQNQAIGTAVSRYVELPVLQRSVVVDLKDVLGESLNEIAALLGISVDAV